MLFQLFQGQDEADTAHATSARLLDAEAIDGAARPHVEPPAAERRRGMDFVADIVDAQDFPLRRRLQDRDLAFDVCQEHLAVGRDRRRVGTRRARPGSVLPSADGPFAGSNEVMIPPVFTRYRTSW